MKHTTSSLYAIDHINAAITVTKTFLKEAGVIGSDCYQEMLRLRRELPDYKFQVKETKKPHRTKIGSNLNYKKMRHHIEVKDGLESTMLKEFEKVLELAKSQHNPFQYTKDWFLAHYKVDFAGDESTDETPAADSNITVLANK